ncbi:uncharacterized protein BDZ99DRAFT_515288 [Mytilinidion resinicola]|uniref:Uncharacterized protein n=1 Tax=Mytilinidion resinicola TaxID=574789 RepID=A0A6A6Z6Q4_9PEZI|nr:uncharacterized protein BDZ99DRAFT_515288 [Mytilinidion resinicola]KAF2816710.1 hypothetical protein BDZ99DRAFT_515288 [Mytilinidion resinicola]
MLRTDSGRMFDFFDYELDEGLAPQPGAGGATFDGFLAPTTQQRSTAQGDARSMFDDPECRSSQAADQLGLPRSVGYEYGQHSLGDYDLDDEYDPDHDYEASSPKKPKRAKRQGPPAKTNDLFSNMVKDEDGLYFGSAEDVLDVFMSDPLWKPGHEELPYGDERRPYVIRIRNALLHLPASESMTATILDNATGNPISKSPHNAVGKAMTTSKVPKETRGRGGGLARWKGGYYQPQAIEAAAHLLIDRVVSIHEFGWMRPNLDPKQLDMETLYQPELSFDERINSIERVLKSKKHTCKWVLDNDDLMLDKLAGGPGKYEEASAALRFTNLIGEVTDRFQRSNTNKQLNDLRQIVMKAGREEASKSEDKKKAQPAAKSKRKANQIARADEDGSGTESGPSAPKQRKIRALSSRKNGTKESGEDVLSATDTQAHRGSVYSAAGGNLLRQGSLPTYNNNVTPAIDPSNLRRSGRFGRLNKNGEQ